jgi:hypothetical protein
MVDVVKEVQTPNGAVSIGGSYDPSFEAVFKEFEQNFSEREEVGAGVSITLEGATVRHGNRGLLKQCLSFGLVLRARLQFVSIR